MTLQALAIEDHTSHGFGAGLVDAAGLMPRSHAHGDVELNYVYSGSLRYFLGGRFVEVPERRLCVFWGGLPHQTLDVAPGTSFMWLHVPLARLLSWSLGKGFVETLFGGVMVLDAEGLPWDEELTRRWLGDLESGDAVVGRTIGLEVEARLRRLVRSQQRLEPHVTDERRGAQVAAMASFLAAHYADEVTIKDIAAAAKINANYATLLFRRECGMSLWQYLTRLRVTHAELQLLCTDKTVLSIALESGFGSLARFYAAFHKECGMPPGEYRQRSGERASVEPSTPSPALVTVR